MDHRRPVRGSKHGVSQIERTIEKKKKKRAQNDVDFDLLANENGNIGPLGVQSPSFLRLGC